MVTRQELYEFFGDLADELAPPPPPPPPGFNNSALRITAHDTHVPAGERVANVLISLNEPAKQTMTVQHLTRNGTAVENFHFKRTVGWLAFHPGDQYKVVQVPLIGELGTKAFEMVVTGSLNTPPLAAAKSVAKIATDPTFVTPAVIAAEHTPLMTPKSGKAIVFEEQFDAFVATDSGYLEDGFTPCWRTRLGHGREQTGNKELAIYSDPVLHQTQPWADGALQAQYFPDGVLDADGNTIPMAWKPGDIYRYSAPMITTQRLFNQIRVGTYVEGRMTMPTVKGTWPAFWIMPNTFWLWPLLEIDIFEGFFNSGTTLARVGSTLHWKNASGGHSSFGLLYTNLIGTIDLALPHTWGMHWGEETITYYVDGMPIMAVPNVIPDADCYLKINIAVGGLVGTPPDPEATFPVRMPLEWVKVWQ